VEADPAEDGTRSGTFVVLHPGRTEVLIGGTFYAGEIKKSIFTVMNDRLLLEESSDALLGQRRRRRPRGDFLRLSGTGKTTLSADPGRSLIGDDEHGWGDSGIFQFRRRLLRKGRPALPDAEPEISARRLTPSTILENVVVDENGVLDLDDASKTENTRAAYKLEQIGNALPAKRAGPSERAYSRGRSGFCRRSPG
jgi:phosphoenolpyruvate carboxykinase (ATP)